jgi:hypothetical protein
MFTSLIGDSVVIIEFPARRDKSFAYIDLVDLAVEKAKGEDPNQHRTHSHKFDFNNFISILN